MSDIESRVTNKFQLTTDDLRVYLDTVEVNFGAWIDYSMLIKLYGNDPQQDVLYSPAEFIGARPIAIMGNPDPRHISTSFVERQNPTMRMSMRRFTRLTNGFSKKVANLEHSVALHHMWYNLTRVHRTLRVTPGTEAGISDQIWRYEEIARLSN